jgi:signal transduction histidine kinase/DNA-binding response OmpR family regulator/HPt (histidine-containing phosphotransfer) domain-containing protein
MALSKPHRFGVAGRITSGLIVLALLSICAAGLALWGQGQVRADVDDIVTVKMVRLEAVGRLVQRGEAMAAIAPRISTTTRSANLRQSVREMKDQLHALAEAFENMRRTGLPEAEVDELGRRASKMTDNLSAVVALVEQRVALEQQERSLISAFSEVVQGQDARREELRGLGAEGQRIEDSLRRIDHVLFTALTQKFSAPLPVLERKMREERQDVDAMVATLRPQTLAADISALFADIDRVAAGPTGIFAIKKEQLDTAGALAGKLHMNHVLTLHLVSGASAVLKEIEEEISADRTALEKQLDRRSRMLSGIVIASVLGAVLVIFYLRRRVVSRVITLQQCMSERASGIPAPIPLEGRDEISDMARTFSYFVDEIARRESALSLARDEADKANKARGDFLANMSHEIRTPMNAIVGLSHLALKTDLSLRQRDYLVKIGGASNNLLGIINDILDFSKIEAGKLEIERVSFNIEKVLDSVSSVVVSKTDEKGLEFVVSCPPNIPQSLLGDPLRLTQILTNLCGNAVKFTNTGAVVLSVHMTRENHNSANLQFEVRDTGIGMNEEQQGRLFKSFSQADSSTTRKYGGTGLGLSISKQLVELMGGEIGVRSEPGVGSTFYFTAEFGIGVQEEQKRRLPDPDLRGKWVLVVDDNEISRNILDEYLTAMNFNVRTVESGDAALKELERVETEPELPNYDLVLMDWKMPKMSGIDASRRIKENNRLSKAPTIIMVTAFGREEVMREAEDLELGGFMLKPFNASILFDTIMNAFGRGGSDVPVALQLDDKVDEAIEALRGGRVLLAEDNEINQQVAVELLEDKGLVVTVVSNGREAVDAVLGDQDGFSAVLMDIQMPVMDGYEATAEIRSHPEFKDLPILAMTAHAMRGEREKSISKGMNDHINKPIDPDALFDALVKWIKPTPRIGNQVPEEAAKDVLGGEALKGDGKGDARGTADPSILPDSLLGFDLQDALRRLNGKERLLKKLLLVFRESYGDVAATLQGMVKRNELEEAQRLAHTLKGAAGNLSAKGIAQAAGRLEQAFADRDLTAAATLSDELEAILAPSLGAMDRAFVEEQQGPLTEQLAPMPAVDPAKFKTMVEELGALLEKGSLKARKVLPEFAQTMAGRVSTDKMERLVDFVERLDFSAAKRTLDEITEEVGTSGGAD